MTKHRLLLTIVIILAVVIVSVVGQSIYRQQQAQAAAVKLATILAHAEENEDEAYEFLVAELPSINNAIAKTPLLNLSFMRSDARLPGDYGPGSDTSEFGGEGDAVSEGGGGGSGPGYPRGGGGHMPDFDGYYEEQCGAYGCASPYQVRQAQVMMNQYPWNTLNDNCSFASTLSSLGRSSGSNDPYWFGIDDSVGFTTQNTGSVRYSNSVTAERLGARMWEECHGTSVDRQSKEEYQKGR